VRRRAGEVAAQPPLHSKERKERDGAGHIVLDDDGDDVGGRTALCFICCLLRRTETDEAKEDALVPAVDGRSLASTTRPARRLASAAGGGLGRRRLVLELEFDGRRGGLDGEDVLSGCGRSVFRVFRREEGLEGGDIGGGDEVFGFGAGHPGGDDVLGFGLDVDADGLEAGVAQEGAHFVVGRGARDSAGVGLLGFQVGREVGGA